jgi:ankyrin repeat protein
VVQKNTAAGGHHEIVRLLITHNANINQLDIDGNTPLHFAAFGNFPHSTNELLQSGQANVLKSNGDGKSAFTLAVENRSHLTQAVIENFISGVIGQ